MRFARAMGRSRFYSFNNVGANNCIYRRCRVRDTIKQEVGRGKIASGYCTYVSSPGCTGTRFEQSLYFNVKDDNLAWDVSTMAVMDWTKQDFVARSPIRKSLSGIHDPLARPRIRAQARSLLRHWPLGIYLLWAPRDGTFRARRHSFSGLRAMP